MEIIFCRGKTVWMMCACSLSENHPDWGTKKIGFVQLDRVGTPKQRENLPFVMSQRATGCLTRLMTTQRLNVLLCLTTSNPNQERDLCLMSMFEMH